MPKARAQKKTSQKMAALPDLETFMSKLKKMEKGEQLDLSSDEDLSIGIMNLISIEEHFFFTYNKTGKKQYLDLLNEVREMRKTLLKQIIKEYEGEVWCISKHLLSASMRFRKSSTTLTWCCLQHLPISAQLRWKRRSTRGSTYLSRSRWRSMHQAFAV